MAEKIARMQQLTGNKADLPNLRKGEFALCQDVDEVYIGNGSKNVEVATENTIAPLTGYTSNISSDFYMPTPQTALPSGDFTGMKTADVYGWFDALVADLPEGYCTKTLLGQDASQTFDIFLYDFNPGTPTKTVIFPIGVHPEKHSIYGSYLFMKDLLQNWQRSSVLTKIRLTTRILVIPVVNPYGLDNNSAQNANGVNLNRNAGWESLWDASTQTESGTAWFSEPEAQYLKTIIDSTTEACLFFTPHSGPWDVGSLLTKQFIYTAVNNSNIYTGKPKIYPRDAAKYVATKYNLGYAEVASQATTLTAYASSKGVPGLTAEWNTSTTAIGSVMDDSVATMITDFFGNLISQFVLQPDTIQVYNWYFNAGQQAVKWTQEATNSAANLAVLEHLTKQFKAPFDGAAFLRLSGTVSHNMEKGKNVFAPVLYEGATLDQSGLNQLAVKSNTYLQHTGGTDERWQVSLQYNIPITKGSTITAGIQAGTGPRPADIIEGTPEGTMVRFRAELVLIPGTIKPNYRKWDHTPVTPTELNALE